MSSEREIRMPFGRHKGMSIKDIPAGYLKWLSTIELREPLRSAVKVALSWKAVPLQKELGMVNSTTAVRTSQEGAFKPAPAASKSGFHQSAKPKRQWIPRPENEDLSQYYSNGVADGIPW
jgi:hypothetical protein